MDDEREPLGVLLRRQVRDHPQIGMLGIILEQKMGTTLELMGTGIERRLMTAAKGLKKLLSDKESEEATGVLAEKMAEKLVAKLIKPQLADAENAKTAVVKLEEINGVLASLMQPELDKICATEIAQTLEETTKTADPDPPASRSKPRRPLDFDASDWKAARAGPRFSG